MNKKGFSEIVILGLLAVGAVLALKGPSFFRFGGDAPTDPPEASEYINDYSHTTPHFFINDDGETEVRDEVVRERIIDKSKRGRATKALTFGQSLAKNLANLTTLTIVIVLVLAVSAPTLLFSFLARARARWKIST